MIREMRILSLCKYFCFVRVILKTWRGRPTNEHGNLIVLICECDDQRDIRQSTYSKMIRVATESHDIMVAVGSLASEARFSQTLM